MRDSKKILIIGNGPAGNEAASIIRKHSDIGISIFSAEPYSEYSACFLHEFVSGTLDRKSLFLKNENDYASSAISTFFGRSVHTIDASKKSVLYEGERQYYDKLIIAMGNNPILPTIGGINLQGVFAFKTLRDAESISAFESTTVAVVGAGPIGVEISIALRRKGLNVYLIEKDGWILPRIFEESLANELEVKLNSNGIVVITSQEVVKILGSDKVKAVVLKNEKIIDCDMVIFTIGMKPNTDIAKNVGLELGNLGGIITDENMMTNIPDIYACGDCIESKDILTNKNVLNALWPNAVIGGKVAGLNVIGISRKYSSPINVTCIQVYDLTAVSVGYSDFSLMGLEGKDVIEGSVFKGKYRIILFNDDFVGMQVVTKKNNLIPLFNLIYKRERFSIIKKALTSNEFIIKNPLYFSLLTGKNSYLMKKIKNFQAC